MSWPLSQDYNEAIQDPRNSFGDPELKRGETVTNSLGIPLPRSGNFADVYEVRCPGDSRWAVKCFTREVPGLRDRYNEISKYLRQTQLPFIVDFQYLDQGIRVQGQWYPILKMQWVEGFLLNEFVRASLGKRPILLSLGQIWMRMARRLRETNIAHCDLQHGNVLLVPGSTANSLAVKLIDYDGMCIPSLAGRKSGEVGHPAYQHPERLRTGDYNSEIDRFSLLCIATALRCLLVGGRSLWERYDNGDNLLFRQSDFQAPVESPLFRELLAIGDPHAQLLVQELYRACQGSLKAVPLMTDLVPEEPPASARVMAKSAATTTDLATAAQGPDWDFAEGDVVVKRRRRRKSQLGMWGAVAGAAVILLVVAGVAVGLMLHKDNADKNEQNVARNKPKSILDIPKSKPPSPGKDRRNPIKDKKDPPNVVNTQPFQDFPRPNLPGTSVVINPPPPPKPPRRPGKVSSDLLTIKCELLEQAREGASTPVQNRTVAQKALLLVERGLMREKYDLAARLLNVARTAAAKADVKEVLKKSVEQAASKLDRMRGKYEQVKKAAATLADKPADPEANLVLGMFRCVHKDDWEGGLPLLVKGSDKALAVLAEKDLADTDAAVAQAMLGDGWYDLATKTADKTVKIAWQRRAYRWYEDAYPKLPKGEQRDRLRNRIPTLTQQLGLAKVWHHMDLSGAKTVRTVGGVVLHLLPHRMIATRQWYGRPIEVTVIALLGPQPPKNHVRITLLNGGELSVTLVDTKVQSTFYYAAGDDPDGTGIGPTSTETVVKSGEPLRLRYRATSDRMEIWINDNRIAGPFNTRWKMDGSSPVRVWSDDSEVDIASVVVKRIHDKPAASP